MITMQQRTMTITDPREAKEMDLLHQPKYTDLPEAAQQTKRDFDEEIKDCPEAVIRQERYVRTPWHVRH